jgi:hypothetical protein
MVTRVLAGHLGSGSHLEPKLFRGSANTVIKSQKFNPWDSRANGQCRCQVNRIKCPNGSGRKRMPRAFNNVRTDAPQVPVASCGIQVRPAVRGRGFVDFSGRDRADQHAITLNQRKIGRHHEFGVLKHLTHGATSFFSKQPR